MDEVTVPADTPCAGCGEPIGTRPWKQVEGRIYHDEHVGEPREKTDPLRRPTRPGRSVEEIVRGILQPGQQTFDEIEGGS